MLYRVRYNEFKYNPLYQRTFTHKNLEGIVDITEFLRMCNDPDVIYLELLEVINENR